MSALRQAAKTWRSLFRGLSDTSTLHSTLPPNQNTTYNQTTQSHSQSYSCSRYSQTKLNSPPIIFEDNPLFGDPMLPAKDSETIRIYCQNLNGIKLSTDGGDFHTVCGEMDDISADYCGFSKHCLDTTNHRIRNLLQSTHRKHFQHSRIFTSSSDVPASNFYKPGGTMAMAMGRSVA